MSNYLGISRRDSLVCPHIGRKVKARNRCGGCYNKALRLGELEPLTTDICPTCRVGLKASSKGGGQYGQCLDCKRKTEARWRIDNPAKWALTQRRARLLSQAVAYIRHHNE